MTIDDIQFTSNYWVILLPVIAMAGDFVTGYIDSKTIEGSEGSIINSLMTAYQSEAHQ